MNEQQRILAAYEVRQQQTTNTFFGYENVAHLGRIQERFRETLKLLASAGYHPLSAYRLLDVGCGDGNMLRQFLQWGVPPANLSGIELRPEPVAEARQRTPHLDIRCGSAANLPWPNASFDLVCQHTVFTSILDPSMKQQVAQEMGRVLRPGGAILWYDFTYNNPHNPDVQGVKAKEIKALFPNFKIQLRRITLAPPLARRLPEPLLPVLYPLLAALKPLCTHYLGLFVKN